MRRVWLWLLVVFVALAAAGVAWWFLVPNRGKAELEVLLGEALGREVRIGTMTLDPRGHVTLHDVDIGNPEGWGGEPMLHAAEFDLDVALSELFDREIDGVVVARGVELRAIKHGGTTNLTGLVRPRQPGAEPIDLHLDVAIRDSRVVLEDRDRDQTLTLDGVDVRVLLSNRDGARNTNASVRIAEVGLHGLPVRDVTMTLRAEDQDLALDDLAGTIGERGRFTGSGQLFLAGDRDWQFAGELQDVDLDADVRRVVAAVVPPLMSSVEATAAKGRLGATVTLAGRGLHWEEIAPFLAGTGTLRLTDLVLPQGSLLLSLAALVGRGDEPFAVGVLGVSFTLAQGWITLERVTTDGQIAVVPITGRVALDGALDLTADLMPLLPLFGGGAYREVAQYATSLPVRIRGTVVRPELAPPSVSDVGKSLLGGALRRALAPVK